MIFRLLPRLQQLGLRQQSIFESINYYFIYLLLQIPFGFLFDRLATRKMYFWMIIIAPIAAIIPNFSNALIGIGYFLILTPLAGVFIGTLVMASRWFTPIFCDCNRFYTVCCCDWNFTRSRTIDPPDQSEGSCRGVLQKL